MSCCFLLLASSSPLISSSTVFFSHADQVLGQCPLWRLARVQIAKSSSKKSLLLAENLKHSLVAGCSVAHKPLPLSVSRWDTDQTSYTADKLGFFLTFQGFHTRFMTWTQSQLC